MKRTLLLLALAIAGCHDTTAPKQNFTCLKTVVRFTAVDSAVIYTSPVAGWPCDRV